MWVKYYDISEELPNLLTTIDIISIVILIFTFVRIGTVISKVIKKKSNIIILKSRNGNNNRIADLVSALFSTVIMLCMLIGFNLNYRENYEDITTAVRERKYQKIEGKVRKFIAMNGHSQKVESFYVKHIKFSYSVSFGYRTPKYEGGIIDKEKLVRIHYYKGMILRLWVWEEKKK